MFTQVAADSVGAADGDIASRSCEVFTNFKTARNYNDRGDVSYIITDKTVAHYSKRARRADVAITNMNIAGNRNGRGRILRGHIVTRGEVPINSEVVRCPTDLTEQAKLSIDIKIHSPLLCLPARRRDLCL